MCHRKRETALLLAGLFLLAACSAPGSETPTPMPSPTPEVTPAPTPTPEPTEEVKELWGFPIDETHDAFEVPTRGKPGTVLVTVDIETGDYHFSVWKSGDLENPIQTMEAESFGLFRQSNIVDANFDGYMDFSYIYSRGNQSIYGYYWIWDEENGLFENEPEFNTISDPSFDEETEIISGYAYSSVASGTHSYYRWEDGKLICVRQVEVCYPEEDWTSQQLVVRDRINGKLTEVYRETFGSPNESERIYEEAEKWQDLSYHGEDTETLWGFPIDDTHDAFEVPTGGKLGTVLVTVKMREEGEEAYISTVSVWNPADLKTPIQTLEIEGVTTGYHKLMDANFDGHMDFVYTWFLGARNDNRGLYVWDEEMGQFVPTKDFLGSLRVDEEKKRIYIYTNGAGSSGAAEIFRWENKELIQAREIGLLYPETLEDGTIRQEIVVEEPTDGEWREIYREAYNTPDEIAAMMDAYYGGELLWYDLGYHGS